MASNYSFNTKLPFSHGIETENHLVLKDTGRLLVGEDLLNVWELMFDRAAQFLQDIVKKKKAPADIMKKIKKIEVAEEEKREKKLKFVWLTYKLGKKDVRVNIFGPDPNISQITWLLELVTPPCEYLEELDWWIDILYNSALYGLAESKNFKETVLLTIGLSPFEAQFRSGLSCGTHHHVGIPSKSLRIAVYNMLRNYIPHLIALTASSPFMNQQPSGKIIIRDNNGKKQVIGRGTHSHRLAHNKGQVGPNIPEYLPILNSSHTKDYFSKMVKKQPPDDRMVDAYPFTDYDTIELRFFDAQPWIENRLAFVLLIQALALKASKLISSKKKIPCVSSTSLFENRRKSVQFGLLAQFTPDFDVPDDFTNYYNFDISTGTKASKLIHSVKSLLLFVKEELETFNLPELVNYLLVPVLGTEDYVPPFSIVEHLLSLYETKNKNLDALFPFLFHTENITNKLLADGNLDLLKLVEIIPKDSIKSRKPDLSKTLLKDLSKRKKAVPKKTVKKKKKVIKKTKKKVPKKVKPVKKEKKIKKPTKKPSKKIKKEKKIIAPKIVKAKEKVPTAIEIEQ
ncbi:MAG: glutamate-cysteine ligase family protein, partial [Candidatus Hodarchaeales archaeon]